MKKDTWLLIYFLIVSFMASGQEPGVFPKEWWFWPDYTLDRAAKNPIGPSITAPKEGISPLSFKTSHLVFFGKEPTERFEGILQSTEFPNGPFSIEMWLLYHVNQEVGLLATLKPKFAESDPKWLLGIHGDELLLSAKPANADFSQVINEKITERGWKNYWAHLVATYDGNSLKLYLNGKEINTLNIGRLKDFGSTAMQFEIGAYLGEEPYMQLGDLLKCLRVHDAAITLGGIKDSYSRFQSMVTKGVLYPNLFHYTAGPYLQAATTDQMGIVWETSEPSSSVIYYGTSLPLAENIVAEGMKLNVETNNFEGNNINKFILRGLEAGQTYFYNIQSTSEDGEVIETGVSTFCTAPNDPVSFTFSVIGDTEARPHINNRVSKLLWDERPEFLLNLGDLTDGGKEGHKFQWNYEYFHGMNQLTSRIPVFPVAGNGEGDLFWFKKYHLLPGEGKAYYKFSYGNADFFMLDSNRKDEFSPGGEQFVWLEKELGQSTADWKFVAHHHAPYSSDEDDYGDSWKGTSALGDPKIKPIVPLYEKYGVDMVFFGHLHTYQRTHPIQSNRTTTSNGVTYVQAGGAGGNLEDFAPTRSWFSAKTFRGHHYLTIEVFGQSLELRMYDSEGRMKDIYRIEKNEDIRY